MIAGTVLVVEDGEVVTMITHLVKTEVLPFANWDDRTHLDGLIGTRTKTHDAGDDEIAEGRMVVISAALLIALQPVTSGFIKILTDVRFATHALTLHILLHLIEVKAVHIETTFEEAARADGFT